MQEGLVLYSCRQDVFACNANTPESPYLYVWHDEGQIAGRGAIVALIATAFAGVCGLWSSRGVSLRLRVNVCVCVCVCVCGGVTARDLLIQASQLLNSPGEPHSVCVCGGA
jgi:hypothetical protein